MHKDFAEWYRTGGIEPNGDDLLKRWAAIREFSPDREEVVSLTRLFYSLGKPNENFLSSFVNEFQKTDPTFKTRDNAHEMSILAGAELIDVIERSDSEMADMAALALVCAAASNLRPGPRVREIPEIAARYLAKRSSERVASDSKDTELSGHKELSEALKELGKPYDMLAKQLRYMNRQLALVTEESNILWWLFSEHSRDEEQRWSKYSVSAVALMAGKELADLAQIIPGPPSSLAFLDRVIRCSNEKCPALIKMKDAINETPISWREQYGADVPSELEDVAPVSSAVKLSVGSPEKSAWLPAFSQKSGIPRDGKLPPHVFSYQVYRERLLARAWINLK